MSYYPKRCFSINEIATRNAKREYDEKKKCIVDRRCGIMWIFKLVAFFKVFCRQDRDVTYRISKTLCLKDDMKKLQNYINSKQDS